MATVNDNGCISVTLAATTPLYSRVTAAGVIAGAAVIDVGVTLEAGVAGQAVAVAARTKPGTHKVIAAAAIASGALVYTAADGEVSTTGSFIRGQAMEAAGADQDVIEIMPLVYPIPV